MKTKPFIKMAEGKKLPPVSIAAFSDPNDILSYSLCHSNMPELGDANVADVWVKNAINFGLFANPMSAHQGYWKNEGVINLLVGEVVSGEQKCGAAANGHNQVAK